MINKYIIGAVLSILIIYSVYFYWFDVVLDYKLATDPGVWGQFGDYVGGLLNPLLSFISIVLLIKSLTLQNEANRGLLQDFENSKKTEKIRAFEALFFSMIDSQKELFLTFNLKFLKEDKKFGVDAMLAIEDAVEGLRDLGKSDDDLKDYLREIDQDGKIFSIARAFYIIVKIISDRLDDSEGFTKEDRKFHYLTLINFTHFAQLRLVMMSVQFFDYPSSDYLKNHNDFNEVLNEVNLNYDLY